MYQKNEQVKVPARAFLLVLPLLVVLLCVSCSNDDDAGDSRELHFFYADHGRVDVVSQDTYRLTVAGLSDQQYYHGPESKGKMAVGGFFTSEWGVRYASKNPVAGIVTLDTQRNITGIHLLHVSNARYNASGGVLSFDAQGVGSTRNTIPGNGLVFGNLLLILSCDYQGNPETDGTQNALGAKELIFKGSDNASPTMSISQLEAMAMMAMIEANNSTLINQVNQMQENANQINELNQANAAALADQQALIVKNGGAVPTEGADADQYNADAIEITNNNAALTQLSNTGNQLQLDAQQTIQQEQANYTQWSNAVSQDGQLMKQIAGNIGH